MTATLGGSRCASPKDKTLQLCGALQDIGGEVKYRPFHTYSMRPAMKEGFILDPLRNYGAYETYRKLVTKNPRRGGGRPDQARCSPSTR